LLWSNALDDFDRELCASVGVDQRLLPAVTPSGAVAGVLGGNGGGWALAEEVPVSVGCGDVAATILGAPVRSGRHTVIVGTGAQIVLPDSPPPSAPRWPVTYHTYRQADASSFAMAAVMGAGLALARVVAMLGSSWNELYRPYDLTRALPGFLPYVSGERLPHAIASSSAGWFGIGVETGRADLLAASLEGVAFAIRHAMESLPRAGDDVVELTGGGGRSPVFAQLLADVLARPVRPIKRPDATARGAARLGWRAAGLPMPEPDVDDRPAAVIEPVVDGAGAEAVAARYSRFVARTGALAEAT
jgi:xylulokinase